MFKTLSQERKVGEVVSKYTINIDIGSCVSSLFWNLLKSFSEVKLSIKSMFVNEGSVPYSQNAVFTK